MFEQVIAAYSGGAAGCVVTATVTGLDSDNFDEDGSTLEVNMSDGGGICVQTLADSEGDGDQTLTITLTVTNENATNGTTPTLSKSTFTVLVVERPEFISDNDSALIDSYRAYFKKTAIADSEITLNTSIHTIKDTEFIQYGFWDDDTQTFVNQNEYFAISKATDGSGKAIVTLQASAGAIQDDYNKDKEPLDEDWGEVFRKGYIIGAYDTRFVGAYDITNISDLAVLTINLSQWSIKRLGNATAEAHAYNGCTIADLAEQIGLTANQFQDWLTKDNQATYKLFNGNRVTGAKLDVNSELASDIVFQVPNTIYAVWYWNPAYKDECRWPLENIQQDYDNFQADNLMRLSGLGFLVFDYDNSSATNCNLSPNAAKSKVFNNIQTLANAKALHGLYLTGHGSESSFGQADAVNWGPDWSINYSGGEYNSQNPDTWAIDHALAYKLGAFIAHSCNSSSDETAVLYTPEADGGVKLVFEGTASGTKTINPALLWGVTFDEYGNPLYWGGEQGTKNIEVSFYK